jgi:hypothetical protein
MTFKQAVERTAHLENSWRGGLQALRAQDARHIEAENTRHFRGSIDLDTAWQPLDPQGHRWDFGISYQHTDREKEFVYWVETHTANDSEVDRVIHKAKWLLAWFQRGGRLLNAFEREILWISSGRTSFTLTAPQRKQMAAAGLKQIGPTLRVRNAWAPIKAVRQQR